MNKTVVSHDSDAAGCAGNSDCTGSAVILNNSGKKQQDGTQDVI